MNSFEENYNAALVDDEKQATCKPKEVEILGFESGIAIKTLTTMSATTINGTAVTKRIYIDDSKGTLQETVNVNGHSFKDSALTRYRCAMMTAMAVDQLYDFEPLYPKVGFIGTGRTNLANCIALKNRFGVDNIVVRGSPRNFAKNVGDFMTVCDSVAVDTSDDFRLLNSCDIVIVCTSAYNRDECICEELLKDVKLIIALDCGYYLDESFRNNRPSYCDWPEQLSVHYKAEFPFDSTEHVLLPMYSKNDMHRKVVVYLYGVAIADAVAGEELLRTVKRDGMEKPFIIGGDCTA